MGAYLSEPVTEKISSDKSSKTLSYGASSMQGWRVAQEDAHNCIVDYDENSAYFAVYDGHGGAEVAQYCSVHLPDYIKTMPAYKTGNIAKSLEDAFLEFDGTLTKPEVIADLKQIAGVDSEKDPEEDDEVDHLCEEATMPIEDVLAKYKGTACTPAMSRLHGETKPLSPCLRAKKEMGEVDIDEEILQVALLKKGLKGIGKIEDITKRANSIVDSNIKSEGVPDGEISKADSCETSDSKLGLPNGNMSTVNDVGSGSEKSNCVPESSGVSTNGENKQDTKSEENIKVEPKEEKDEKGGGDKLNDADENSLNLKTSDNDAEKQVKPSKGKAILSASARREKKRLLPQRVATKSSTLDASEEDDSEDSSDEDIDFPINATSDSDEEPDEDMGEDEEDDSEEDDEEDEDDDDDEDDILISDKEEPGSDSGCTAVVALLRGRELYVANAGDSRCVVSKKGVAIDMSFDHKPEDTLESQRIEKAGGKVTCDGRVNGGLNLSRAIGDHAYKANEKISAREQMITALPDVRNVTIHPEEDEFMVLACDGIWNSMTSQEVIDFVRERLTAETEKISSICEQLFDHCLSPNTMGDGTGCDNMTAVIVRFNKELGELSAASSKRPASGPPGESDSTADLDTKKSKTEDSGAVE